MSETILNKDGKKWELYRVDYDNRSFYCFKGSDDVGYLEAVVRALSNSGTAKNVHLRESIFDYIFDMEIGGYEVALELDTVGVRFYIKDNDNIALELVAAAVRKALSC